MGKKFELPDWARPAPEGTPCEGTHYRGKTPDAVAISPRHRYAGYAPDEGREHVVCRVHLNGEAKRRQAWLDRKAREEQTAQAQDDMAAAMKRFWEVTGYALTDAGRFAHGTMIGFTAGELDILTAHLEREAAGPDVDVSTGATGHTRCVPAVLSDRRKDVPT